MVTRKKTQSITIRGRTAECVVISSGVTTISENRTMDGYVSVPRDVTGCGTIQGVFVVIDTMYKSGLCRKLGSEMAKQQLMLATIAVLALGSLTGCYKEKPVAMAPPVSAPPPAAPSNGEVYQWQDVPKGQEIAITRAVFDQGGYQLYASTGETIVVPFANQNMYVMKFGKSTGAGMYFINDGSAPTLYVPNGVGLENAAAQGAKWYPFPQNYVYSRPVYMGLAPTWSDYVAMSWYPGMLFYGGYFGYRPWVPGLMYSPMVGLNINIGGRPYYGWNSYSTYYRNNPVGRVGWGNRSSFNYNSVGRRTGSSSFGSSAGNRGSFGSTGGRSSFGGGRTGSGSFGSSTTRTPFGGGSARTSGGSFGSSTTRTPFGGSARTSGGSFGSSSTRAPFGGGTSTAPSSGFGASRSGRSGSFGATAPSSGFGSTRAPFGGGSSSFGSGTRSSGGGFFGGGSSSSRSSGGFFGSSTRSSGGGFFGGGSSGRRSGGFGGFGGRRR